MRYSLTLTKSTKIQPGKGLGKFERILLTKSPKTDDQYNLNNIQIAGDLFGCLLKGFYLASRVLMFRVLI